MLIAGSKDRLLKIFWWVVMSEGIKPGYKQTEIGVIPSDWESINMSEHSILKARIGWQGLTTAEYLSSGKYYLVTGTDFVDGKVNWTSCHFVDKYRYIQDKNIQLVIGDVLLTKDGTIGKVGFVDTLPLPATLNSGVFVIRPRNRAYDSLFLYFILNSNIFSDFLFKLQAGSTISHLYQKDFVKL
jgi:type I restriction enzyme S subunit